MDAKDIQIFVCKFVKYSVNILFSFVKKYPVVFFVFSILFLLNFFLSSVFYFLLYSFPFVACTLVFIYYYFIKNPDAQNLETRHVRQAPFEKPEADVVMVNRDVNSSVQSINVKGQDIDFDARPSKEILVEKSRTDDLAREIFLTKDTGTSSSKDDHVGENSSATRTSLESSMCGEDKEKKAQEGADTTVEGTEDDQKNSHGTWEHVRFKRLESLIARRKSQKWTNPIQKSIHMINAHPIASVAHVLIARSSPFDITSSSDEPSPGSAPSTLLKNRNPFDLPYDPLEEKPDLTGDSFQQEFTQPHLKDMFFCRHQSFFLGSSFPVLDCFQNQQEGLGFSRVKRAPRINERFADNRYHDQVEDESLIDGGKSLQRSISITDLVTEEESLEQALNQAGVSGKAIDDITKINDEKVENMNDVIFNLASGNDIQNAIDLARPKKICSSSSGSDDDDDQDEIFRGNTIGFTENIHMTGFEFPEVLSNPGRAPIPCPIPKGRVIGESAYDSLPSPIDKSRVQDVSFLGTKRPWHTPSNSIASDMQVEVSELGSPPSTADGTGSSSDGDSLTYQADIDKEITSGSDEIWGVLPCAPKLDQDRSGSKQEYEDSEDDATREQLLYIQKELDNPVASFMKPLPYSTTKQPSEVHRVAEPVDNKTSNSSNTVEVSNSSDGNHLTTATINHDSVEKPPESFNLSNNPSENYNSTARKSDKQEAIADLSQTTQERTMAFNNTAESNSCEPENNPTTFSSTTSTEYEDNRNISESLFRENDSFSHHGDKEQESNREIAVPGLSQTSNNSTTQLDLLVEQVSTNSSTSDSPNSVLPDMSPRDQIRSSVFAQQMDIPALESDSQSEVGNGLIDVHARDNAGLIFPENTQDEIDNSINQPRVSGSETSEDPPDSPDKSISEATDLRTTNRSVFEDDEAKDDARSNAASNAESATELSEQPAETNTRSAEHLESNLVTKDTQDTIKDPKEGAVNIPSLPINETNSSTDHTINSEDRSILQNESDAEKSGEVIDSLKFSEDVKEAKSFQSETSNSLS